MVASIFYKLFTYFFGVYFCLTICVDAFPSLFRSSEICNSFNGRRIYIEFGDRGLLSATNITVPDMTKSKSIAQRDIYYNNLTLQYQCSIELITCPTCVIKITFSHMDFSSRCQIQGDNPCSCDYVLFSEPPYDFSLSGNRICGPQREFETKTRTLSIRYLFRNNHSHPFTLEYESEKNRDEITGSPLNTNATASIFPALSTTTTKFRKFISTPFFPAVYSRDYGIEHIITCKIEQCRIRVIFTDFQVAPSSIMEFYDFNGQRIDVFSGVIFRPPVIISTGPSMLIRFFANGGTGIGYKAELDFLTIAEANSHIAKPFTDCGGVVETLGGAITMMNMLTNDNETRIYDCAWVIKPPNTYLHLKTHLSLHVDAFHRMAGESELIIRHGITSDRPELEAIKSNSLVSPSAKTYVVPLSAGFYVSLRGTFDSHSRLAIVYTAFSYMDCYTGSEFLCLNHRCIPIQLHCDGFDHCGDNSDEPATCSMEWSQEPIDKRWYSHTPNYYFPKNGRYADFKTAAFVFIASSVGLIILITALIILLYRMGNRARQQRALQNHLQTISELLADSNSRQEDIPPEEPPGYDAPPDYEEVIKVGMNKSIRRPRRSGMRQNRRPRSSHRNSNAQITAGTLLEVALPPESSTVSIMPPEQSTSGQADSNGQHQNMLQEIAIASQALETASWHPHEGPSTSYVSTGNANATPHYPTRVTIDNCSDSDNDSTNPSGSISREFGEESLGVSLSLSVPPTRLASRYIAELRSTADQRRTFYGPSPTRDLQTPDINCYNFLPSLETLQLKDIKALFLSYGSISKMTRDITTDTLGSINSDLTAQNDTSPLSEGQPTQFYLAPATSVSIPTTIPHLITRIPNTRSLDLTVGLTQNACQHSRAPHATRGELQHIDGGLLPPPVPPIRKCRSCGGRFQRNIHQTYPSDTQISCFGQIFANPKSMPYPDDKDVCQCQRPLYRCKSMRRTDEEPQVRRMRRSSSADLLLETPHRVNYHNSLAAHQTDLMQ